MAGIGACYPCFAPFEGAEPESGMPAYGDKIVIGGLVQANLTPNFATAKLSADDAIKEDWGRVTSGTIAIETDDILEKNEAVMLGATYDEETGELKHKDDDVPPYGGFGYYKTLMRNNVYQYKVYFYPKVKATLGADNAQTMSESPTFQTSQLTLTAYPLKDHDWYSKKVFDTAAEAKAYIDGLFAGTETPQG